MDAVYGRRLLLQMSVCLLLVTTKKAEPIEVPLGVIDSDEPKEP